MSATTPLMTPERAVAWTRPSHPKLAAEHNWFLTNLPALLTQHAGRFVAIDNGEVVSVGDSEVATLTAAAHLRPGRLILVRRVAESRRVERLPSPRQRRTG